MKTRPIYIFIVLGLTLLLHASHALTEERRSTPGIDHECSRIAKKLSSVGYKECLAVDALVIGRSKKGSKNEY